jgi:oxygen-independent coproporphyrinogen-3 oxidase
LIAALLKEAALHKEKNFLSNRSIQTIYFGGGTPSILRPDEIASIIDQVKNLWNMSADLEITLEANPDDLNETTLAQWKAIGINRLSIGIQSLYDDELKWMNRAHNAEEALTALAKARHAGFKKLSADFIYGGPLLSDERWKQTLEWIAKQQIPHISCYALTVEPKTPLGKLKRTQAAIDVENEKQSRHFMMLMDFMEQIEYEHYEISNFALPNNRSQHNTAYWEGKPYLGLGPSAHSFDGKNRQWNIASNSKYIQSINQSIIPCEIETLTVSQQYNEYVMTRLRMSDGLHLDTIKKVFGEKYALHTSDKINPFIENQRAIINHKTIRLTKAGKLFADAIAADLFYIE